VIHAVVLFAIPSMKPATPRSTANLPQNTINVRIAGLPSKNAPPKVALKNFKQGNEIVKSESKTATLISVPKSKIVVSPQPVTNLPSAPPKSASSDLISYINEKKQRIHDSENNTADENSIENSRTPSPDEVRDANIKRNLQTQGTRGIFEITQKNSRTARFSFKGWKNDNSFPQLEIIDVETGANDNIEMAIVKKIIEVIRRDYKGDFNWESHRLGKVISLSARIEDNSGLEEFLMQEFFSAKAF
jgi:hypothetical protein